MRYCIEYFSEARGEWCYRTFAFSRDALHMVDVITEQLAEAGDPCPVVGMGLTSDIAPHLLSKDAS